MSAPFHPAVSFLVRKRCLFAALGVAIALHALLILAALLLPGNHLENQAANSLNVTLVAMDVPAPIADPVEQTLRDPVIPETAASALTPEPVISDPEETVTDTQLVTNQPTLTADFPDVSQENQAVAPSASGEIPPSITRPTTLSVLRAIQCPANPEVFAATGVCPNISRQQNIVANAETASDFFALDLSGLAAEFEGAPPILAGQPTLSNGTRRPSLSNADSMRDTLPASQPDPAFGD